jgi:hypothetical protein
LVIKTQENPRRSSFKNIYMGYIWSLKDEGILHDDIAIKWRILA